MGSLSQEMGRNEADKSEVEVTVQSVLAADADTHGERNGWRRWPQQVKSVSTGWQRTGSEEFVRDLFWRSLGSGTSLDGVAEAINKCKEQSLASGLVTSVDSGLVCDVSKRDPRFRTRKRRQTFASSSPLIRNLRKTLFGDRGGERIFERLTHRLNQLQAMCVHTLRRGEYGDKSWNAGDRIDRIRVTLRPVAKKSTFGFQTSFSPGALLGLETSASIPFVNGFPGIFRIAFATPDHVPVRSTRPAAANLPADPVVSNDEGKEGGAGRNEDEGDAGAGGFLPSGVAGVRQRGWDFLKSGSQVLARQLVSPTVNVDYEFPYATKDGDLALGTVSASRSDSQDASGLVNDQISELSISRRLAPSDHVTCGLAGAKMAVGVQRRRQTLTERAKKYAVPTIDEWNRNFLTFLLQSNIHLPALFDRTIAALDCAVPLTSEWTDRRPFWSKFGLFGRRVWALGPKIDLTLTAESAHIFSLENTLNSIPYRTRLGTSSSSNVGGVARSPGLRGMSNLTGFRCLDADAPENADGNADPALRNKAAEDPTSNASPAGEMIQLGAMAMETYSLELAPSDELVADAGFPLAIRPSLFVDAGFQLPSLPSLSDALSVVKTRELLRTRVHAAAGLALTLPISRMALQIAASVPLRDPTGSAQKITCSVYQI